MLPGSAPTVSVPPSRPRGELSPRALLDYAKAAMAASRDPSLTLAFLVVDLRRADRLDALMDTPASEVLYQDVLDCISSLIRADDRFSAVSKEEIWLVLPDLPNASLAVLAAIRLVHDIEGADVPHRRESRTRPCVGIAYFPEHAPDIVQLVRRADAARKLAALTEEGYCVFQPSDRFQIAHDPELVDLVRAALNANALEVHYQPQMDLRTRRCRSAEALVRWPSAGGRMVPAAVIAEVAERSEINHAFTLFILNTVLRHKVGFRKAGVDARMSVNISANLLNDTELPDLLAQSLDAWAVPADQLTVEVTEGTFVAEVKRSAQVLERVRQLGVRLAMDDFGTGYSSLAQFKRLPFDEIKIDKLFVQNMLQSRGDAQIVRAMIDLAHNFGLVAVAEGVEERATLGKLRELDCDLVQGYIISKALPEAGFRQWWLEAESKFR